VTQSAKALFRATKAKPPASQAVLAEWPAKPKPSERRDLDYYPTGETEAIRGLLSVDGARIRDLGPVWEPACGDGAMVMEIRAAGIPCCASDVVDRGCPDSWTADYYSCLKARAPSIITNPPYCEMNARDGHGRWLRHTLGMPGWRYLALLLSWEWPAARANGLGDLLDNQPFTYCYLMRWKIDFTGQGNPAQRNAWFVWDLSDPRSMPGRGPHPEPGFRFMDKPKADPRQEAML